MSLLVRPAPATAADVTGMSISTSLASVTARTWSLWAKETMATSRLGIGQRPPSVLAGLVERRDPRAGSRLGIGQRPPSGPAGWVALRIGLAVGGEVPDPHERRADLVVAGPHRLDPHADVDVVDGDLLEQVHEREIGA